MNAAVDECLVTEKEDEELFLKLLEVSAITSYDFHQK